MDVQNVESRTMRRNAQLLLVTIFGAMLVSGVPPQISAQVVTFESANRDPSSLDQLPTLNLSDAQSAAKARASSPEETERRKHFDKPNRPPIFDEEDPSRSGRHYVVGQYQYAGDHNPIPIKDADSVVVGTILSSTPHLSASGTAVYSTFSLSVLSVLKGRPALVPYPISLEREGGIVLLPSGKKRFEGTRGVGLPVTGFTYILFLKAGMQPGSFSITTGYALVGDRTIALDAVDDRENALSPDALLKAIKAEL